MNSAFQRVLSASVSQWYNGASFISPNAMLLNQILSIVNLTLALLTLFIVLWFGWRQRHTGVGGGWRLLVFALILFVIGQTASLVADQHPGSPIVQVGAAVSVLYMGVFLAALYRLFEDVVNAQQDSLNQAQEIIHLQNESVQRAQEAETLIQIAENLISSLELETVMQELCRRTRELLSADSVSVRLPRPTRDGFRFAVDFASALKERPARLDPHIDRLAWRVLQTNRPALIPDAHNHPMFGPDSPPWMGALALYPLADEADAIGVLTAVFGKPRTLTPREKRIMKALANYAAIAVHNAYLYEQIEQQASLDGLTLLANRHVFNHVIQDAITEARQEREFVSLVLCDMDNLKNINDRYGHAAGDAALIKAAETLRSLTQEYPRATLARFGGDEFAILLPDMGPQESEILAQEVKNRLAALPIQVEGKSITACMSVGWASLRGAECTLSTLLQVADERMYAAKHRHHEEQEALKGSAPQTRA